MGVSGRSKKGPPGQHESRLEVEADLARERARRDVVRPAERGQEVVERLFIRHIDHGEPRTPFEPVSMEDIVVAHGEIKEAARSDALWIMVVVFSVWGRYLEVYGSERIFSARGKRSCAIRGCQWVRSDQLPITSKPGLERLISR